MPVETFQIQSLVTTTATGPGSAANVSLVEGDYTLFLRIHALSAGKTARLVLETSADDFATVIPAGVGFSLTGALPIEGVTVSWRQRDLGKSEFGAGGGDARWNLVALDAGASITFESWVTAG